MYMLLRIVSFQKISFERHTRLFKYIFKKNLKKKVGKMSFLKNYKKWSLWTTALNEVLENYGPRVPK